METEKPMSALRPTSLQCSSQSWRLLLLAGLFLSACTPRDEVTIAPSATSAPAATPSDAPTAAPTPAAKATQDPMAVIPVSAAIGQAAVVSYVQDGDLLVWDQATGQSQTIIDTGDVTRVELSHDGQLVAFLRRSFFTAGGYDQNEQSALWVVGRDGSNPRELVSAAQLREQVDAAEADSTNFPRLAWIPNSHRLLYSGNTYEAHGYGEGAHTPLKGVYLIDADTAAATELRPAEQSAHFIPSPDGQLVVLVNTTGLSFFDVDSGRRQLEFPAAPVVGDTGWFTNAGVWTQDSSAFVINALVEPSNTGPSDYELWRVPVDGSPAAPLIAFAAGTGSVVFAPDGSAGAILGAAAGTGASIWFILPLPEDLGPLAVPGDSFDYSRLIWSPGGTPYVFDLQNRGELHPLCPNAGQAIEVCGAPIHSSLQIEWFEWIDRDRFLYVTILPRQLYLGSMGGSATMIAEDPPSFTAVASTCVDYSEYVADMTVPDGTHFAPGTVFQKTWRVRNSGTCTWDASYRFGFFSGERMSGPRSTPLGSLDPGLTGRPLFPTVQPGEDAEVSVMLIAPASAGTHRGQWKLFAPDGTAFGTAPFVVIRVP